MSDRVRAALGYATRIAESVAQEIDSRHVFVGLMLVEEHADQTTLSSHIHKALAQGQPPNSSVAPRLVERLGGQRPPDTPGGIGSRERWSDDGQRLVVEAREVARPNIGHGPGGSAPFLWGDVRVNCFRGRGWLESDDIDPAALRSITLKAQQDFPVAGEDAGAWRDLLATRIRSGRISGYVSDQVTFGASLTDRLGLETEVEALSAVIMAKDVTPPMSVGLFGDWGTGKTYFMSLMREQIQRSASAPSGQRGRRREPRSAHMSSKSTSTPGTSSTPTSGRRSSLASSASLPASSEAIPRGIRTSITRLSTSSLPTRRGPRRRSFRRRLPTPRLRPRSQSSKSGSAS